MYLLLLPMPPEELRQAARQPQGRNNPKVEPSYAGLCMCAVPSVYRLPSFTSHAHNFPVTNWARPAPKLQSSRLLAVVEMIKSPFSSCTTDLSASSAAE